MYGKKIEFGRIYRSFALSIATVGLLTACDSLQGNIALGTVGATVLGAQAPSHEIEQIYYLGSYDPQGQLPPEIYRIRVHGQASFISRTNFASGWVRAGLIDSLGTTVGFQGKSGRATVDGADPNDNSAIKSLRKLVQFGPEGFREAPKDHRLVVVMGSNPEAFFEAVDTALGSVSAAQAEQRNGVLTGELFESLVGLKSERERLVELNHDLNVSGGK
jgi:hypothetical protein